MTSFVALTPNPAIDRTSTLPGPLQPASLHRVASVREAAGGKGVNVARVLTVLGSEVMVAGFLGGFNGRKFRHLLEAEGLDGVFHEVAGETRECQIVLGGDGHPTELNEPGPPVSAADWRQLMARLPTGPEWQYVVSGSLPTGLHSDDLGRLLAELPGPASVDTSGTALAVALGAGVELIAPNRAELKAVDATLGSGAEASLAPVDLARALFGRHGVPILLTLGTEGAAYVGHEVHLVRAPSVTAANPVGSGDALLAAFLHARGAGRAVPDALRLGVAAGVENAVSGGGARVTREGIERRYEELRSEEAAPRSPPAV